MLEKEKITIHALALAEAVRDRQTRLDQLKRVRKNAKDETAEELSVATTAYKNAKRIVRESLAAYCKARAKVAKGEEAGKLDGLHAARLRLDGWNV